MSFLLEKEIKEKLSNNPDLISRKLQVEAGDIYLFFLKSTTDKTAISKEIIEPILRYNGKFDLQKLKSGIILSSEIVDIKKEQIVDHILKNQVVVAMDDNVFAVDLEKYPVRVPAEPPTSPNIYGPREGFVESLSTNVSLIRRRLPTKNLVIKNAVVGRETNTKISVIYLKNIADKSIVKQLLKKINNIDIDGVVDSYYIAEFIKLRPKSIFEQVGIQEKPDIVVAKVLEGRIAILVDGSPIVITVPYMIFEDLQSSNDYYTNYIYVNIVRIIRSIGIILATIIPGLYLSIRLYSYSIIPLNYVIVIANSTKNLPFTPVLEIFFILILFQILYEVSLRLPQYLGLATSIVGALILGDTGVRAGLISPPGVIVVAVSIMAIYTIPAQASQLTILRAIFIVLGSTVGIFGIVGGMVYVINYINTLNAYNTPYLAPYAPKIKEDYKDAIFKKPLVEMIKRPKSIPSHNFTRLASGGEKNEK
ncbi:MAG: spore germination protein [Clostridiales bacterium]|nr:spore germination protein [Clostridiales bacterium]